MTATAELAIRARRAAFNRAIAEGDAAGIGPILAKDCVMLTGTDSAVIAGRSAQVALWRRQFAGPDRMYYIRTPDSVSVSPIEPIALEQGSWGGEGGGEAASGLYSAKWREAGGVWVIEAEIFVTMA